MKSVIFLLGIVLALTLAARGPLHVKVNRGLPLASSNPKPNKVPRKANTDYTRQILPEERDVVPSRYEIQLTPILIPSQNASFDENKVYGTVKIRVQAATNAASITINAFTETVQIDNNENSPTITVVAGTGDDNGPFTTVTATPSGTEEYAINFTRDGTVQTLMDGAQYDIYMTFVSEIQTDPDHLYSIYKTTFLTPTGGDEPSVMATTQFEPTGAREAFPCFDEPHLKAIFQIKVGHPPGYTAYNNERASIVSAEGDDSIPQDWVFTTFEETPNPMSTYLLAVIVAKTSDYSCVESAYPLENKEVRVCGPTHLVLPVPDGRDGGAYPANQSAAIINFFNDYTNMDYTFSKMDSVGIPDFLAGAMENWGLNTYRIPYLLYYPGETTESERLLINEILSHELVHQWFGNTVTCKFWDQIWMNEGFADYFQYFGMESLPDAANFIPFEMRQYESTQTGLEFDASVFSHPVINLVTKNSTYMDIMDNAFTPISYQKGATLLRMLAELLTQDAFDRGIQAYLMAKSYQPVVQNDFFEVMYNNLTDPEKEKLEGYTIKAIMDTWTLQSGFPLLRVTKVSDTKVYVSQERFIPTVVYSYPQEPDNNELDPNHLWTIPLRIITNTAGPNITKFLDKSIAMTSVDFGENAPSWILLNPEGNVFYRVLYDTPLFGALLEQLNALDGHTAIPNVARSQLFDDYFTFVDKGFTYVHNALELTTYLGKETTPVVWHSALYHLTGYLNKLTGATESYDEFKTYMEGKLLSVFVELGELPLPDGERGANVILRSQLIDWACLFEMQDCIDYASDSFQLWKDSSALDPIPVDVRTTLLCSAVVSPPETAQENYDFVHAEYQKDTTLDADKFRFLDALACSMNTTNIDTLLSYILNNTSPVTSADHRMVLLSAVAGNTVSGREAAISFFTDTTKTEEIITAVTPIGIVDFYQTLANFVLTDAEILDLERAARSGQLVDVLPYLNAAIEGVRANVEWRTKNEADLTEWFRKKNQQ